MIQLSFEQCLKICSYYKSKWHHHLTSTVFRMEKVVWHSVNFADRQLLKKVMGGVAFFLSLHQHDLFLYGGCYKDYENSRKCSSTEAAPHLTLPTFPTSDTHLFTAIHQKHWSPKYPILSFLAPLVRTSWISHHGQHNLFFFLASAIAIFFQYACRTMMGQQNFWRGAKRKY